MGKRFKRKTFGLIVDYWANTDDTYHDLVTQGIQSYAEQNDINLVAFSVGRLGSGKQWEAGRSFIYNFIPNKELFDGFLVLSLPVAYMAGIKNLEKKLEIIKDFPMVSISAEMKNTPSVVIDNKKGFSELLEHLIVDHNYTKFAFVSGVKENTEAIIRHETFLKKLNEHQIPFDQTHIFHGDFLPDSGSKSVSYFYDELKISPEIIVCANDNMAMGVLQELWNRGKTVPRDVAVTGFDDFLVNKILDLPFTTVKQPLFSLGYLAAENLDRQVKNEPIEMLTTLPSGVVYRTSCRCNYNQKPNYNAGLLSVEKELDNKKTVFIEKQFEKIKKVIKNDKKKWDKNHLFEIWNSILLEAVKYPIKREDIEEILGRLLVIAEAAPENNKWSCGLIDQLRVLFSEFYVHVDVTRRIKIEETFFLTTAWIDSINNETLIHNKINRTSANIKGMLELSKIENCYITLFDDYNCQQNGTSTLKFCYINNNIVDIGEEDIHFPSADIIPKNFLPSKRFELVIEPLFEQNIQFGFLILNTAKMAESNPYEILRRRFSSIFEMLRSRKNLIELNNQLQKEVIHRKHTELRLQEALDQVRNLSLTDELTKLYNRRGFLTLAEQQKKYCLREHYGYILFYMDLDGLKKINDIHGHKEGDFAIISTGEILKNCLRDVDIIARLGGDEFTVFIPNTSTDFPQTIVSRIELEVEKFNKKENKPYQLSISMGFCASHSREIITIEEMMEVADQDLYQEKQKKKLKQKESDK